MTGTRYHILGTLAQSTPIIDSWAWYSITAGMLHAKCPPPSINKKGESGLVLDEEHALVGLICTLKIGSH